MDSEIEIRTATPADAGTIAELGARTFQEAFGADNRPEDMAEHLARSFGPELQADEMHDPAMLTLLAESQGRAIGYVQMRWGRPPALVTGPEPVELMRFYVDRPWHGRGVAQRLMEAALAGAAARGARTVWLGVWEKNPRAIAFYGKIGFQDVGSHIFYLGSDAQTDRLMTRPLAP